MNIQKNCLYDVNTGGERWSLEGGAVDYSPDGSQLAIGNTIWKLGDAEPTVLRTIDMADSLIITLFSPDGHQVAMANRDGSITLRDAATGEALRTLHGHQDTVTGIAFSPHGRRLVSASPNGSARMWDVDTGDNVWTSELVERTDLNEEALELGRSAGCRAAFLEVRESNTNARRLYVSMGFREVGQRRNYYSRPREHAIQYRKEALDEGD